MEKLATLIRRKPYLRFFASVQLAVPLLLTLATVVAVGTIIESRYNSDYARLLVYDSPWFMSLMLLLALNIFLSTISRYPWKVQHIGFVTVHVGLLTLLFGGYMTKAYGIDGQLRVEEGSKSNSVSLGDLSLDLVDVAADFAVRAPFTRGTSELRQSSLDFLNDKFNSKIIVRQFLPFAEIHESYSEGDGDSAGQVALGFMLKSGFFDVSEWLQSEERPEMNLGPATVRLILDSGAEKSAPAKTKTAAANSALADRLMIHDEASGKILAEVPVNKLKPGFKLGTNAILVKAITYRHAVVLNNRLAEGDPGEDNPALELEIKTGKGIVREIAYAKFPNFALNQHKGKSFGLKFAYIADSAAASESEGSRSGNVIEFHVRRGGDDSARLELYKNNKRVFTQELAPGESVVTPWMGIKVTLGSLKRNAKSRLDVTPATLQPRSDLPPAALYLSAAGTPADRGFWLAEGQFKRLEILGREYEVYFGHRSIQLPFNLQLEEFKKMDYPGTETPMSFESHIKLNGEGQDITISMNEPLAHDGYTIYQSSYDIRTGQPRASIFSVNRDPGRPVKYAGGLILALGIIIFTLMRSRLYQKLARKAA